MCTAASRVFEVADPDDSNLAASFGRAAQRQRVEFITLSKKDRHRQAVTDNLIDPLFAPGQLRSRRHSPIKLNRAVLLAEVNRRRGKVE